MAATITSSDVNRPSHATSGRCKPIRREHSCYRSVPTCYGKCYGRNRKKPQVYQACYDVTAKTPLGGGWVQAPGTIIGTIMTLGRYCIARSLGKHGLGTISGTVLSLQHPRQKKRRNISAPPSAEPSHRNTETTSHRNTACRNQVGRLGRSGTVVGRLQE